MIIKFMKHVIVVFLLSCRLSIISGTTINQKCPIHQQHFEKILGFRPDVDQLTHVLYRRFTNNETSAINLDCWNICNADIECTSYVLFFATSECFAFTENPKSYSYQFLPDQKTLVADPNAVYFQKSCMNVPNNCKSKLWPNVRVPGSILVGVQGNKKLASLVSRKECAERCISESEFKCLSASFIVSHKNNLLRLSNDKLNGDLDIGQCTLNEDDKSTRSDSYRVANIDEEYIENQCVQRAPNNVFCSFEQYTNSHFVYSEYEENGLTQKECQEKCAFELKFYCQGVSFFEGTRSQASRCLLHSEDTISLGPRAIKTKRGGMYLRRVKCLNLTVTCDKNLMTIEYKPVFNFNGLMTVNSHVEKCSTVEHGDEAVTLTIPLGNEKRESRCGIIRAYEITGPWNRTLISTLIVIQMNPLIQTQGDRLIKVGCILNDDQDDYSVGSSIEFGNNLTQNLGAFVVNGSAQVLPRVIMKIIDLSEQLETNDVQLGQNLEFVLIVEPPNGIYEIRAKNLFARSGDGSRTVKLLDEHGCPTDASVFPELKKVNSESTQTLRARFHAFKFSDSPGVRFETVIQFCVGECPPVRCKTFRSTTINRNKRSGGLSKNSKIVNNSSANLPFTDSGPVESPVSMVEKRNVVVSPPSENAKDFDDSPDNIYQSVFASYNRTSTSTELPEVVANIGETTRNNFTDYKRILRKPYEIPLQFEIKVHSPQAGETESLVYGENSSILVAGIDLENQSDKLCISPGIISIILAFWLLIQVVLLTGCCVLIKKYRKLAELEDDRRSLHRIHQSLDSDSLNRRVRWADQGSTFSSQVLFAT